MIRHDTATPISPAGFGSDLSPPLASPNFLAHLTPDDKFIDIGFPLYESVAPGTNRVVAPIGATSARYIRTTPLSGTQIDAFLELTHDPYCIGAVFHSLPQSWVPILARLPSTISVLWRGWGYEYYGTIDGTSHYNLLAPLFPRGLLLPLTRRLLAKYHATNTQHRRGLVSATRHTVRSAAAITVGHNRLVRLKQQLRDRLRGQLSSEHDALKRIDFFAPVIPEECSAAKLLHPWFSAQAAALPYDVARNIADAQQLESAHLQQGRKAVLVGNSASLESNHLDAFALLAGHRCFDDFDIVVPLSYGRPWYRDAVVEHGRKLFGDRFKPLVDFMPVVEYHRLLHSCTHALMAHLRQQAGANVLSLIASGAKIAMHHHSLLYQHYRSRGFHICTMNDLRRDPITFAMPLDTSLRNHNIGQIAEIQSRQEIVRATFTAMADLHRQRAVAGTADFSKRQNPARPV